MSSTAQMRIDLLSKIEADTSIAAYSALAPQGQSAPYVVLYVVSNSDDLTHDGATGLPLYRVQLSIYAATIASADNIGDQIKDSLHGFRGTVNLTTFGWVQHTSENDDFEPDTGLRVKHLDFLITTN